MGCCCVRSRSRRHVSSMSMLLMLLIADFYTGHMRQLRGSDLSSIPLPPLCATLSISFVAVPVPTASLIGRPWNCFMFLVIGYFYRTPCASVFFFSFVMSMVFFFL